MLGIFYPLKQVVYRQVHRKSILVLKGNLADYKRSEICFHLRCDVILLRCDPLKRNCLSLVGDERYILRFNDPLLWIVRNSLDRGHNSSHSLGGVFYSSLAKCK